MHHPQLPEMQLLLSKPQFHLLLDIKLRQLYRFGHQMRHAVYVLSDC